MALAMTSGVHLPAKKKNSSAYVRKHAGKAVGSLRRLIADTTTRDAREKMRRFLRQAHALLSGRDCRRDASSPLFSEPDRPFAYRAVRSLRRTDGASEGAYRDRRRLTGCNTFALRR